MPYGMQTTRQVSAPILFLRAKNDEAVPDLVHKALPLSKHTGSKVVDSAYGHAEIGAKGLNHAVGAMLAFLKEHL
jgi:hypothetical protein